MMFLDCPAYLDHDGAVRCGLPAEVEHRFTMPSSDGPAESVKIRCPAGHWFNGAIESLIWESRKKHDPGSAGVAFRAGRSNPQGSHRLARPARTHSARMHALAKWSLPLVRRGQVSRAIGHCFLPSNLVRRVSSVTEPCSIRGQLCWRT